MIQLNKNEVNVIMEEAVTLIKDLGFPVFVAIYMLVKNTQQMKEFTKVLEELKVAIIELKNQKG